MKLPLTFLGRTKQRFLKREAKRQLSRLDDRVLADIGIARDEIDYAVESGRGHARHHGY